MKGEGIKRAGRSGPSLTRAEKRCFYCCGTGRCARWFTPASVCDRAPPVTRPVGASRVLYSGSRKSAVGVSAEAPGFCQPLSGCWQKQVRRGWRTQVLGSRRPPSRQAAPVGAAPASLRKWGAFAFSSGLTTSGRAQSPSSPFSLTGTQQIQSSRIAFPGGTHSLQGGGRARARGTGGRLRMVQHASGLSFPLLQPNLPTAREP